MPSEDGVHTFEEIEDRALKIGTSVYGKIHFNIPFKRTTPLPDQYIFLNKLFDECKPFALTRIDMYTPIYYKILKLPRNIFHE